MSPGETIDLIISLTSRQFGITKSQLPHTPKAKHLAVYIAREQTTYSLEKLAEIFGYSSHGSVRHGIEHVSKEIERYRVRYTAIKAKLSRSANTDDKAMIEIVNQIAESFQVTAIDITGKSMKREISDARKAAIIKLHELGIYSLQEIGLFFGNISHSTVSYNIQQAKYLIETDKQFKTRFDETRTL